MASRDDPMDVDPIYVWLKRAEVIITIGVALFSAWLIMEEVNHAMGGELPVSKALKGKVDELRERMDAKRNIEETWRKSFARMQFELHQLFSNKELSE